MTNEEAIKILDQMPIAASFNFTFEEMAEALQMATKSLKNERPQGKWELHRKDLRVWFECSNCGAYNGGFETDFCPNCGADMKEADNDKTD